MTRDQRCGAASRCVGSRSTVARPELRPQLTDAANAIPGNRLTVPVKTGQKATDTCSGNGTNGDNAGRIEDSRSRGHSPIAGKAPLRADSDGIEVEPTRRPRWHQEEQAPRRYS